MNNSDSQYLACELIKSFHKTDSILTEILKEEEPSVVDIGCGGYPYNLYILYHDFRFKKLIGIEMEKEEEAFNKFLEENKNNCEIMKCKNRFEIYRNNIQVEPQDQPLLNRTEYYRVFDIKFKTKAEDYFKSVSKKTFYNCLILSNMLHYLLPDDRYPFFIWVSTFLKPGGILYLRMNENHSMNEQNFKNLIIDYRKLFYRKIKNNKLKNIDSLIYLGIKK